ncbi:hypothetical protein EVA_20815 [gut metagenome]|uniref:Uncharacterized protein n=1 Tax=gut metagenome TaxID=749906 RepID=J9F866_9ZZZZ
MVLSQVNHASFGSQVGIRIKIQPIAYREEGQAVPTTPQAKVKLEFIIGIKPIESSLFPFQNFLRTEETLEFDGCSLGRIARMNDIFLETHAIGATDGAGSRIATISRSCQSAYSSNSIHPLQTEGNDGSRHHGILHPLEEGLLTQMGIVLTQYLVCQLHHLHSTDTQSLALEDIDNFSHQSTLQGAGFQQYQSFFQCHK